MYKIFFNNRAISIGDAKESENFNGTIYHWKSLDDIKTIITDFEKAENALFIVTCNATNLLELIKQQYVYIEAAGGVVGNKQQQLLAIFRLGKWDLPKGKVEEDETVIEAAAREVEEECGISNVQVQELLKTTYHTYEMFGKKWLKKTYWYKMFYAANEMLTPQTEEDIERVVWLDKTDLELFKRNTYASILEVINEI